MKKMRRIGTALLTLLLMASAMLSGAQAEGNAALRLEYAHEGTAVAGAEFELYHVASGMAAAGFTLTAAFEAYPVQTQGLDQTGWQELALTLAGFAQRDSLTPVAGGTTDAAGKLTLSTGLAPGLYLLLGSRVEQDGFAYTATPAMVAVQGKDLTIKPKHTRTPLTPELITRKVLKIWKDEGVEKERPAEIEVQLLRNGTPVDTAKLNATNSWSYTWANLNPAFEWLVTEKEVPVGYSVKTEQVGMTYTITNTAEPCIVDPPVKKQITGDTPTVAATFRFVMEAVSNTAGYAVKDMPMPEGSVNGKKTKDIKGAQEFEFGEFMIMKPGTYIYHLYEEDTKAAGYGYDDTVYTVIMEVTENNGKLSAVRTVKKGDEVVTEFTFPFNNSYKFTTTPPVTPQPTGSGKPSQLPQTGQVWWPVPLLALVGLTFVVIGVTRKKRDDR